ncbi:MAG: hypothetical protein GY696_19070 [Gammaproteobacteria bacterium]|nr:hypothetical protein [Gammaproteobacteria bacterium]
MESRPLQAQYVTSMAQPAITPAPEIIPPVVLPAPRIISPVVSPVSGFTPPVVSPPPGSTPGMQFSSFIPATPFPGYPTQSPGFALPAPFHTGFNIPAITPQPSAMACLQMMSSVYAGQFPFMQQGLGQFPGGSAAAAAFYGMGNSQFTGQGFSGRY